MNPELMISLVDTHGQELRRQQQQRRNRRAQALQRRTRTSRARRRRGVRAPLGFFLVEVGLRLLRPPRRSVAEVGGATTAR
ncbi:MAG TPA: hypothetical protein VMD59_09350 [Acidimicrobiales bacterium]|nr:hypothetical protein [Acidimicrobiales bacterium]